MHAQRQIVLSPRCEFRILASTAQPRQRQVVHVQYSIRTIHVQEITIWHLLSPRCFPGCHVRNV